MLAYMRQRLLIHLRTHVATYFFIILVFVVGVVIGALAARMLPDAQKRELLHYLNIFIDGLKSGGAPAGLPLLLGDVVFHHLKVVILIWVLGFTIIGLPFVWFIVFTRGFIIGFTVGFLVHEYILRGLLLALASVLPHNFLAVPAVLMTGAAAVDFSLKLVRRKKFARLNLLYESIGYTALCAAMCVFMCISAVVEVYVSPVLMKLAAGWW